MVRLLPGDIIDILFGGDLTASEEVKEQAREQLGLNGSYAEQYWRWISGVVQGRLRLLAPQHRAGLEHPRGRARRSRSSWSSSGS